MCEGLDPPTRTLRSCVKGRSRVKGGSMAVAERIRSGVVALRRSLLRGRSAVEPSRGGSAIPLVADASGLAREVAQVEQARPAHDTAGEDLDRLDAG